jgi:peptide/nickel transport system substrate-binding protein
VRRLSSAALGLVLASLLSCQTVPARSTPAPSGAQAGGIVRVAIPGEVTSLDPWSADDPSLVATRQIFETLVTVDIATGRIGPGLASSWQASNDGASWTFTLREGVRFHDGSSLDASAVVASFERGRPSRYRLLFDDPPVIARTQAVDARTIRFDLRTPFGPFLAHLGAPQAAIARGTSGSGPFAAGDSALAPDGTLTLRRSDSYWRRDPSGKTLPYLDGLVLRPVRDAASRLAELRGGRVEVALDLPVAQAAAARSDPSLALLQRRDAALASLGINASVPPFDRPEARRAVAMTIGPPSALDAVYAGLARRAIQVVPLGALGYDDSVVAFAPLDVAGAKKLLADARVPTPINVDLAYPIVATAAYPDPQRIAQSIAADLGAIGVVARLRAVDPSALRDDTAAFTLDTTPIGLDPDDVFWPLFGSDDAANVSLVVGLLRKARTEADPTKRTELYKQVSKIARSEVLRVPLLFADRANAASARVAGYAPTTGWSDSFGTVWLRP